jgi:hypothetical protein
MEFPVPLLTLLQLQSYLVPCISARIFIILKLQNIHWRQFFNTITLSELFFLCIERLPNCYSVSSSRYCHNITHGPKYVLTGHISHALPTEMIFTLLRSIPSSLLYRASDYSRELSMRIEMLETITKWLQVSVS